jgi:hypothetical protein
MLDSYTFEEIHRLEQILLDQRNTLRAAWREREPQRASVSALGGVRRRLAQALLLVADRLDPRAVVSVPHIPSPPSFNGTLHHA